LIQGTLLYKSFNNATNSFIIFHKSRFTLIGEKINTSLKIYHNFDSITSTNDNVVKNFRVGNFINEIQYDTIKNIYLVNDKKLLIIDSLGAYNVKTFKPHYVLLRNSPKINLNRVIDSLKPELIIADGSNYKSYVDRWEATCAKQKLLFHQTSKKGALIFK
jgi:competence protein ComEC